MAALVALTLVAEAAAQMRLARREQALRLAQSVEMEVRVLPHLFLVHLLLMLVAAVVLRLQVEQKALVAQGAVVMAE